MLELLKKMDDLFYDVSVGSDYRAGCDNIDLTAGGYAVEHEVTEKLVFKGAHPDLQLAAELGADGQNLRALEPGYAAGLDGEFLTVDDEISAAAADKNKIAVKLHDRVHFFADSVFLKPEIFVRAAEYTAVRRLAEGSVFSLQNVIHLPDNFSAKAVS